ncbi:MAG: OmpA family protein [Ilyomonas sp.]
MRKIIFLTLVYAPITLFSQSAILQKIKDKAKARAEQHVDAAIDKSMDKTEEEISKQVKQQAQANETTSTSSGQAKISNEQQQQPVSLKTYSRYDFIPGERIVYAEDFSTDAIGELPLKWTTNNRGETVAIETMPGKWMRLFAGSRFVSPSLQKLPENFTVEADILMQFEGEEGYTYPELEIKLLEILQGNEGVRSYVVNQDAANEAALVLQPNGQGKPLNASLRSYINGSSYFFNQPKESKVNTSNGKVVHLAVWVQKERIRYWLDGEKVFDIPQAIPAKAGFNSLGLSLESSLYTDEQLGIFISNIKVAEGTPDMRSKLLTEGKLVTNGILFDIDSDRIKPESAGVLKEIASVLKDNASVNIKIIGYTDSDGEEAHNLDLSKRRSIAVQKVLTAEYGIDASRMKTDGLGETNPVAENNTKEGKAKNRRVEFIKL